MKLKTWLGSIAIPVLLVVIASPRIANASSREDRLATNISFATSAIRWIPAASKSPR